MFAIERFNVEKYRRCVPEIAQRHATAIGARWDYVAGESFIKITRSAHANASTTTTTSRIRSSALKERRERVTTTTTTSLGYDCSA